jgi:hypothetical protein
MAYNYKKPRAINWVSVLVFVGLAAGIYWAARFVPVYYKRAKVDQTLENAGRLADNIMNFNRRDQWRVEEDVLAQTTKRLGELGITTKPVEQGGNGLVVSFDPDYARIRARYTVVIKHPIIGKKTVMKFDRSARVTTNSDGSRL